VSREIRLTPAQAIGGLLLLHLAAALAFFVLVPAGAGPDEGEHIAFVQTLAGELAPAAGWRWGLPVLDTDPRDPNSRRSTMPWRWCRTFWAGRGWWACWGCCWASPRSG
jgi:hypothetical protein